MEKIFFSCADSSHLTQEELIMLKRIFASLIAMLMLAGAAATLSACNTVEGAGKDIQQGGKAMKDEANEHK